MRKRKIVNGEACLQFLADGKHSTINSLSFLPSKFGGVGEAWLLMFLLIFCFLIVTSFLCELDHIFLLLIGKSRNTEWESFSNHLFQYLYFNA